MSIAQSLGQQKVKMDIKGFVYYIINLYNRVYAESEIVLMTINTISQ